MNQARLRGILPGQVIGVCAPAGPVDTVKLGRGIAEIEGLGFGVRVADGVLERTAFTAGSVTRRVREIMALFSDDRVGAIVCARGGAGAAQLLDHIDTAVLRAHPKAFIGYSDITHLHLLLDRLGLASMYGPMAACGLADGVYDRESFLRALCGAADEPWPDVDPIRTLRRGSAAGVLRGGCLSILAAACGTSWKLAARDGTILLLEDVDEPPYRIDRYLRQLRFAGAFEGVRGVVFGEMPRCAPSATEDYTLEQVIDDALDGLSIPIAIDLPVGHTSRQGLTLPLGVAVSLECGREARLDILETGTE
ncbi:MAG: LD-carboxypeptidase [Vicinamibacteria bacterium]|nr:LD-carboxypeptidase [Vicinamibacteria bacterium]